MAPMTWGIVALARRFTSSTVAGRTALIGACLYFAMWSVVGSWSEMRIGVPFAMALLPFTCVSMARFLARNVDAA